MAKRRQYSNRYSQRDRKPLRVYFQFLLPIVFAGLLVGFGYWGWHQLMRPDTLPFRQIQILNQALGPGEQPRLLPAVVKKVAWKNLNGGFFSANMVSLKQALLRLPWVADVSIQRHWPGSLALHITEQRPIARWGKTAVVSDQGDLFYPAEATIPKGLPEITGPIEDEKEIIGKYQKLSAAIGVLSLEIRSLKVSSRLSYRLLLSNDVLVIIGRENVISRFNRFLQLYPRLIRQKSKQVLRVDLRYPNGLAIKWKSKRK